MKKIIALILICCMTLFFVACGSTNDNEGGSQTETEQASEPTPETETEEATEQTESTEQDCISPAASSASAWTASATSSR